MIQKIVSNRAKARQTQRESELLRKLIRREAQIGGEIFGPLPEGHRREFFCLDKHTWVWHEEWTDKDGQQQIKTTRYDVRPTQIVKSQNGIYSKINESEARRLQTAVKIYKQRVKAEIYKDVASA